MRNGVREAVFWGSAAVQAPADYRRFNGTAGFVIAPFAIDKAAGERQLIRSAVVFAKHLDWLIRRRFAIAIELSQTSFARRHFLVSVAETRKPPDCVPRRPLIRHRMPSGSPQGCQRIGEKDHALFQ